MYDCLWLPREPFVDVEILEVVGRAAHILSDEAWNFITAPVTDTRAQLTISGWTPWVTERRFWNWSLQVDWIADWVQTDKAFIELANWPERVNQFLVVFVTDKQNACFEVFSFFLWD